MPVHAIFQRVGADDVFKLVFPWFIALTRNLDRPRLRTKFLCIVVRVIFAGTELVEVVVSGYVFPAVGAFISAELPRYGFQIAGARQQ